MKSPICKLDAYSCMKVNCSEHPTWRMQPSDYQQWIDEIIASVKLALGVNRAPRNWTARQRRIIFQIGEILEKELCPHDLAPEPKPQLAAVKMTANYGAAAERLDDIANEMRATLQAEIDQFLRTGLDS